MQYLYAKIVGTILAPFIMLGALLNPTPLVEQSIPKPDSTLGAALPSATAVFETSLASPITSSATSMTLTANSIRGGGALSGYNCFTIDEGSAQAETICGTVSGTTVSSISRGISQSTGTTTVASLQFAHRRGANVKITDFPIIQILKAQNNGEDTFPRALIYDSTVGTSTTSFPSTYSIINRGYVDYLAFAGVPAASETASGFVELATGLEAASSTSTGSAARLVLPASIATSTYNASGSLQAVITQNNNKIDSYFIATSTLGLTASSSNIVNGIPLLNIGKNIQVFSSTGTTTFAVPSGVSKIMVEVQGGGGSGASGVDNGTNGYGGGGGGAGGYAYENVDVSATSTIQVYVGAASEWSTFGTNGFYLSASKGESGSGAAGGAGGIGSGGDLNIEGSDGDAGKGDAASGNGEGQGSGGSGGSSRLGGGGRGGPSVSVAGSSGNLYGGGGGGGAGTGSSASGGAGGAQGIVIVRW